MCPEFEVTWQMTGITFVEAADDLDAKTKVDAISDRDLLSISSVQDTRVIATNNTTREVEPKK